MMLAHDNIKMVGLDSMFEHMSQVLSEFAENSQILFTAATQPVENDQDAMDRAELIEMLMNMATKEDDIAMVYAHAISDRVAEYEDSIELPEISAAEMLQGLMDIKGLKHIAPQSVISDILKGKRTINIKQAKGFSEFFNVPIERFID